MVRLVVVGASGGVGRHLITQGLEQGHDVVAVCRETSNMSFCEGKDGVTIRRGKVDDVAFMTECMRGSDVVLSAIGVKLGGFLPWSAVEDPTLLARAGPALAKAASDAGVARVMAVSAAGVGDSWGMMPLWFKMVYKLTALQKAFVALEPFEKALFAGTVETCCVRPTELTDDAAGALGPVVEATALSAGRCQIPRAGVAKWMLEHLEGEVGRAPIITATGATATK